MTYDFDKIVPRKGTGSIKWSARGTPDGLEMWDRTDPELGNDQVLPMWIADMDFECAPPIVEALQRRAEHPIFGYTAKTESFLAATIDWFERRHNWKIDADWISITPGVVPALAMAIRAYSNVGDGVLIQTPVYYPFSMMVENNDRRLVKNSLVLENGVYRMDYDDLAAKAADPSVKVAILCSPHNPVGRVWSPEELRRVGDILIDNGVVVISDEIHCDITMAGFTHTPFASLGDKYAQNSVTCIAASKAFNLAGLNLAKAVTPNPDLRAKFDAEIGATGLFSVTPFGAAAMEAAFRHGEDWLEQALAYMEGNYRFLVDFAADHMPQLNVLPLEGTFLAWIDCRALGLDKDALETLMFEKAGLYFDEGYIFGEEGEGFERINLACPRAIVERALTRMAKVIDAL